MQKRKHWNLGAKLAVAAAPFALLALLSISLTLWVSWQLDGGAAAVNEAGRMRMQAYRMSLLVAAGERTLLPDARSEFERSLALLSHGDPERPLFMPRDEDIRSRFDAVGQHWRQYSKHWLDVRPADNRGLREETARFTGRIDALVAGIEAHMSRWTALLNLMQLATMALAVIGATVLLYIGYLFVLEPVGQLKQALERIQQGDLGTRVERNSSDEFGTLADGFNDMADQIQAMYRNLEAKVSAKTAELQEKRERLEALYEVTSLIATARSLEELARGFVGYVARAVHADGVALRWSDEANRRYVLIASQGLPAYMTDGERCLRADECHCGAPNAPPFARVIPIQALEKEGLQYCSEAGFETLVSVPVRLKDRLMGEVDLFFHAEVDLSPSARSLLEALATHLASGMENLRLNALQHEAAVSQERNFLANELHDSIAQSLAFMKMQVEMMRTSLSAHDETGTRAVLDELDAGLRESTGDVRELLLHFRTRTNSEDIEAALQATLRKFEHQSGVRTTLTLREQGLPLPPDLQIQVLHIVQEALSNVRKHARAGHVWLDVQQQPQWRIEVRDDGRGFETGDGPPDETHVGLHIMQERAARIGARIEVFSTPGKGTSVVLTLPASDPTLLDLPPLQAVS
ncbi:Putative nitrate/nitrite sensor protein narQ [Methyloversatilis universalis FAM5]|uniref:Sensor protein n=1 Tax=Methyloversatilis universalis (strain ATCC BAA-1314 / DSM 25237 / JCM 13912 / CCUG 52030 / FAM5) TaxID=1000565 RepID=F5RDJ5_METUF|nr:type IV pili methyl-accepting chemotaxis transducer N-terminal domain-containing protein [Methyloversatilis universalis]EGK70976.1 Putative nitrate/nitrite sensor protein narQ [Methyloversatilis universalis FAM5]